MIATLGTIGTLIQNQKLVTLPSLLQQEIMGKGEFCTECIDYANSYTKYVVQ